MSETEPSQPEPPSADGSLEVLLTSSLKNRGSNGADILKDFKRHIELMIPN